tara:strand:- start:851 stop:1519 length:669 start_codon:yes stop_codon:yes gene_type:complete
MATVEELEAIDAYREKKDLQEKVMDKGQKRAGIAKLSFDSAVALTKLILRQRQINNLRRLQAQRAAALKEPTVTDADMAEYSAMADAAVRQAQAQGARGQGGGGLDIERLQRARELALQKFGKKLSEKQKARLEDRQITGKQMQEDAEDLRDMQSDLIAGTFKDIQDTVKDEGTIRLLGQAGIKGRLADINKVQENTEKLGGKRVSRRGGPNQVLPTPSPDK